MKNRKRPGFLQESGLGYYNVDCSGRFQVQEAKVILWLTLMHARPNEGKKSYVLCIRNATRLKNKIITEMFVKSMLQTYCIK